MKKFDEQQKAKKTKSKAIHYTDKKFKEFIEFYVSWRNIKEKNKIKKKEEEEWIEEIE